MLIALIRWYTSSCIVTGCQNPQGVHPEEGVQAYGRSYSSVTSSGSIRYELGVMRFPCNEIAMSDGFEKQSLALTVHGRS